MVFRVSSNVEICHEISQGGTVLARICRCDRLLSSTLDKARSS
jgi:hypothetical protein